MKILIVSPNYPYSADKGDRIRVNGVIDLFKELGATIDLICLDSRSWPKDGEALSESKKVFQISKFFSIFRMIKNIFQGKSLTSAYYLNSDFIKTLEQQLNTTKYDLIVVFSSSFDYLIPLLKKYQIKIFWDLIDFDSLKWEQIATNKNYWKSWIYRREARLIKEAETRIIKFADFVAIISFREINRYQIIKDLADKIFVLPLSMEIKQIKLEDRNPNQLVFTGQMDYFPNVEAVKFFDQQVMPIVRQKYPNIIFKVVGRNASSNLIRSCQQTVFTGEVAEVSSILADSIIAVVPLKSVFGVPSKLLEALSVGLPTIVTSEVAKTIPVTIGQDLLVADTAIEFASQIDFLLQNPESCRQFSEQAKTFMDNNFSRRVVAKKLADILDQST